MATETKPESPVPDSAYADYEQDLLNDEVPPAQARATRRALERVVDRLMLALATKADARSLQEQISELHTGVAVLKAEMRLLKWMFAIGGSAVIGLLTALLVVVLTRL